MTNKRVAKRRGGGGGGVPNLGCLGKLTSHEFKREKFKSVFLCARFLGNLETFMKWKRIFAAGPRTFQEANHASLTNPNRVQR